jgi:hypothetical protein
MNTHTYPGASHHNAMKREVPMTSALTFVILTIVFAWGKIVLEKRLAPIDAGDVDNHLSDAAFTIGCSVYDLFANAGAEWHFSQNKIDQDFKKYLRYNQTPHYVSAYLRRLGFTSQASYQRLLYSGGRPPYL